MPYRPFSKIQTYSQADLINLKKIFNIIKVLLKEQILIVIQMVINVVNILEKIINLTVQIFIMNKLVVTH